MPANSELINYLSTFVSSERFNRIQKIAATRLSGLSIVLEDIFDAHNTSAVLRSCEAFGAYHVDIIENHNFYKVNKSLSKGADKWLKIKRYKNIKKNNTEECINDLKNQNFLIAAASPHAEKTISEIPANRKIALMFGSEKDGLSDYAIRHADIFYKIPMTGFVESFNISVSCAICLYDLSTRMRLDPQNIIRGDELESLIILYLKKNIKNAGSIIQKWEEKSNFQKNI